MRRTIPADGRLSLVLAGLFALASGIACAQETGTQGPGATQSGPAAVPAASAADLSNPTTAEADLGNRLRAEGVFTATPLPVAPAGPGRTLLSLMPPAAAKTPAEAPIVEYHPVVIELYTSQGCSACPPADALLAQIASRDDVIALALHVDYWDYIGWKDKFATPGHTKRQKAYARAAGEHAIYTPQMIIAGQDQLVGLRPVQLTDLVDSRGSQPSHVRLTLTREGDMIRVKAEARPPLDKPVQVQLVRYRPQETVPIEAGENAGKVIRYSNIVTDWKPVADWAGQEPLALDLPAAGGDAAVVILQEPGPGPVVAAEVLR
ncbi:DUF1223 domain-containing protein [Frigidibacter sp. MR17.14]|uniref:DUF1223 domain-containing protein n=1 Tax=Frigidibacter sp. MR17.14 TaxID=3126509 RepID=UPI003012BE46